MIFLVPAFDMFCNGRLLFENIYYSLKNQYICHPLCNKVENIYIPYIGHFENLIIIMKNLSCIVRKTVSALILLCSVLFLSCDDRRSGQEAGFEKALYGFEHPQDSARTKVWWFHGETETTREGITADLEAFKAAGVGGVVYYDQTHGKMEHAFPAFCDEWWEMLRFAAEEAERLGLSFEVHVSNGFVAGGPWITPALAMKRLQADEFIVEGGRELIDTLPAPTGNLGYYRDIALLAFPISEQNGSFSDRKVRVSTNAGEINNLTRIFGENGEVAILPKEAVLRHGHIYVNLAFDRPFTARAVSYEMRPRGKATTSATNVPGPPSDTFVGTGFYELPSPGALEVSDDGVTYRKVCDLRPIYTAHGGIKVKTVAFGTETASYFRLNLHDWWHDSIANTALQLGKVALHTAARVDQWEEKAGLHAEYIEPGRQPEYAAGEVIASHDIINLTGRMDTTGVLRWKVPAGRWKIMRFYAVPTGKKTKHGRKNLMGLECDKLSRQAALVQWENYAGRILDSLEVSKSGRPAGVAMDSHEAGSQNWTDSFAEEFKIRRGYDLIPYLPVMMGYVVDSTARSERILFDVRRNIADMMADNYYGTFNQLCSDRGLTFTAQAIGNALCIPGDPILAKSKVDKPQGEFWAIHPDGNYDIKESASAAHLYGKSIASAEAYTDAKFSASLADLKQLADYAYAYGINEFVICASAYQPWAADRYPGNTGGGRHYCIHRNNTYWNYSRPFWDYQARNAYVLRQGKPAAQLCLYLGENAPVKILTYRLPEIPGGFDFDAFTTDALISRMDVSDGQIVLPDGVRYELMVLPRSGDITLKALQAIARLVEKGAKVYGCRPAGSGSACEEGQEAVYRALAEAMWDDVPAGCKCYGRGEVYWGMSLSEAITCAGISPDISLADGDMYSHRLYFSHRRLCDADIYFIDNHKDTAEYNRFTFQSKRRYAQWWNSVTGERFSLPVTHADGHTVTVDLNFHPRESSIIVLSDRDETLPAFERPAATASRIPIGGGWSVCFDKQAGGAGEVGFDSLMDWTAHANPAIRYYSGTAVYRKEVELDTIHGRIYLGLENYSFGTHVRINGCDAGIIWCSPGMVEVTDYLIPGMNRIEIHVANSLVNRMIYDCTLPETERITYAYPPVVRAGDTLLPSGLTAAFWIVTDSEDKLLDNR